MGVPVHVESESGGMLAGLGLLIEDARVWMPGSSRISWTAKTHNSHFQVEVRFSSGSS